MNRVLWRYRHLPHSFKVVRTPANWSGPGAFPLVDLRWWNCEGQSRTKYKTSRSDCAENCRPANDDRALTPSLRHSTIAFYGISFDLTFVKTLAESAESSAASVDENMVAIVHHVHLNTFIFKEGQNMLIWNMVLTVKWDLNSSNVKEKLSWWKNIQLVSCPDFYTSWLHPLSVQPHFLSLTTRWHLRKVFGGKEKPPESSAWLALTPLSALQAVKIFYHTLHGEQMFIFRCLKNQTLLIINTSDGQTFSKSAQLCAKVECRFHGRVDKLSVFLWWSERSGDGVGPRVYQQLTSRIGGLMVSDTDCDLAATMPRAAPRAGCVTWKWPITDVLFQSWLLPSHINHSGSVYPWAAGTFRNPSNPNSTRRHLNQKVCADVCSSSVTVTDASEWLCCIYAWKACRIPPSSWNFQVGFYGPKRTIWVPFTSFPQIYSLSSFLFLV